MGADLDLTLRRATRVILTRREMKKKKKKKKKKVGMLQMDGPPPRTAATTTTTTTTAKPQCAIFSSASNQPLWPLPFATSAPLIEILSVSLDLSRSWCRPKRFTNTNWPEKIVYEHELYYEL